MGAQPTYPVFLRLGKWVCHRKAMHRRRCIVASLHAPADPCIACIACNDCNDRNDTTKRWRGRKRSAVGARPPWQGHRLSWGSGFKRHRLPPTVEPGRFGHGRMHDQTFPGHDLCYGPVGITESSLSLTAPSEAECGRRAARQHQRGASACCQVWAVRTRAAICSRRSRFVSPARPDRISAAGGESRASPTVRSQRRVVAKAPSPCPREKPA